MKPIEIETERLYLKAIKESDLKSCLKNFMLDSEVQKYTCWTCKSKKDARKFLQEWELAYNSDNTIFWFWGIYLKDANECIGIIDCVEYMLGYVLGRKYWNQGITTEAASAVLKCMFRHTVIDAIVAEHNIHNVYSGKVLEKIGMGFIGEGLDKDNSGESTYRVYKMTIGQFEYACRYNELYSKVNFYSPGSDIFDRE